jgi:hypothetical protein
MYFWSLQIKIMPMHRDGNSEGAVIMDLEMLWVLSDSRVRYIVTCLSSPPASHSCAQCSVVQVALHSQVHSQETEVVTVHDADMAMYHLLFVYISIY